MPVGCVLGFLRASISSHLPTSVTGPAVGRYLTWVLCIPLLARAGEGRCPLDSRAHRHNLRIWLLASALFDEHKDASEKPDTEDCWKDHEHIMSADLRLLNPCTGEPWIEIHIDVHDMR